MGINWNIGIHLDLYLVIWDLQLTFPRSLKIRIRWALFVVVFSLPKHLWVSISVCFHELLSLHFFLIHLTFMYQLLTPQERAELREKQVNCSLIICALQHYCFLFCNTSLGFNTTVMFVSHYALCTHSIFLARLKQRKQDRRHSLKVVVVINLRFVTF